jgi:hypothetical protein
MIHQVLNYVYKYLNGQWTLKDIQTWLLSNLQRILESGDEAAIEVANQIDADLVELSEGLIGEMEVQARLENYVRFGETIPFYLFETEHPITTHATVTAETFRSHLEVLGTVVDLRLDHKFA